MSYTSILFGVSIVALALVSGVSCQCNITQPIVCATTFNAAFNASTNYTDICSNYTTATLCVQLSLPAPWCYLFVQNDPNMVMFLANAVQVDNCCNDHWQARLLTISLTSVSCPHLPTTTSTTTTSTTTTTTTITGSAGGSTNGTSAASSGTAATNLLTTTATPGTWELRGPVASILVPVALAAAPAVLVAIIAGAVAYTRKALA